MLSAETWSKTCFGELGTLKSIAMHLTFTSCSVSNSAFNSARVPALAERRLLVRLP